MNPAQPSPEWLRYLPILIVVIVLALRMRSMSRERPLKLERMWIVPALYLVVAGLAFWAHPPVRFAWLWCVLALAVGAALGWQRGRMMRISVDPETHALSQRASPAAMVILLGLVAVRTGARNAATMGTGLDLMLLTDVLIAFALGLLTLQRVEMWLRARQMLDAARSNDGRARA